MKKIHIRLVVDLGHLLEVVLNEKQILHIKYASHPGMSTRGLARAYYTMNLGSAYKTLCGCVDFADSLNRGLFGSAHRTLQQDVDLDSNDLVILGRWFDNVDHLRKARRSELHVA